MALTNSDPKIQHIRPSKIMLSIQNFEDQKLIAQKRNVCYDADDDQLLYQVPKGYIFCGCSTGGNVKSEMYMIDDVTF